MAKQETCAERIDRCWGSTRENFGAMFMDKDFFTLHDDGTMDTVIAPGDLDTLRYSHETAADWRDEDGVFDWDLFWESEEDEVRDIMYDALHAYALSVERRYPEGRVALAELVIVFMTGGPHSEIVFDLQAGKHGFKRARFVFKDWFDHASIDITDDEMAQQIFDHYNPEQ